MENRPTKVGFHLIYLQVGIVERWAFIVNDKGLRLTVQPNLRGLTRRGMGEGTSPLRLVLYHNLHKSYLRVSAQLARGKMPRLQLAV
ncbi:hypothetical protein F4X33_03970 [Candidatus Poribacteria bacterium]|nr:hypothetical protein [Candidatus Poribacteria bacterium]